MKNIRRSNIISIILLILVIFAFIFYKQKKNEEKKLLSQKGKVTVALIIKRDIPKARTISNIAYKYVFFSSEGNKIMNWNVNDKRYKIGTYFEVTYLPESPQKSKIEFKKPVKPEDVCSYFEGRCPFSEVKEKS